MRGKIAGIAANNFYKGISMTTPALLNQLAIAIIGIAKSQYDEAAFKQLDIPRLQQTVRLISECVPMEYCVDQKLLHHVADCLVHGLTNEETVMHAFTLYIYRLVSEGSQHPLERGIIKQKINGILPLFETGFNQGLIRADIYDRNADALAAFANNDYDVAELLEALGNEYRRLTQE